MKKILCLLLAIMTMGCLAGCVDHDDDVCDKCEKKETFTNPVEQWKSEKEELCFECAVEKYGEQWVEDALKKFGDD